jgi:hypothetical protein
MASRVLLLVIASKPDVVRCWRQLCGAMPEFG